ncbi:MAG: GSCFA domain-containing protein [Silicimonas sp.]|nr:GSCFA domain-containing protein [Silicimonas sp.]
MADPASPDETATKAVDVAFQHTSAKGAEFRTWFRGEHTNFNPKLDQIMALDGPENFVLQGWLPNEPLIDKTTQITAFGSCFAANISNWLSERNFRILNRAEDASRAYVVTMGEGMVNSFVIRQQFEWAWENKVFDQALWHGYSAEAYGYDEDVRLETKRIFDETEVFILTFGLSEVWYDEPTGNVFWRTIPKDAYDPKRHKFRLSSVDENRDNIRAIYDLIRKYRPYAKVIVTLSPVPLIATFRDVSCITANSVSKATLRVAVDEVVREVHDEGHLFYWPSYELVTDVFRSPYRADRRHVRPVVLNYIMRLFETAWCKDGDVAKGELLESWVRAHVAAGTLPAELQRILAKRRPYPLKKFLSGARFHEDEKANTAIHALLGQILENWRAERAEREAADQEEPAAP